MRNNLRFNFKVTAGYIIDCLHFFLLIMFTTLCAKCFIT